MAKLTPEQQKLDNAINRLNKRLQRAANSLGLDSAVYNQLENYAKALGHVNTYTDSKGVVQVRRDKRALQNRHWKDMVMQADRINAKLDQAIKTTTSELDRLRTKVKTAVQHKLKRDELKRLVQQEAAAEHQAQTEVYDNLTILYDLEHQNKLIDDTLSKWKTKGQGKRTLSDIMELQRVARWAQTQVNTGNLTPQPRTGTWTRPEDTREPFD